MSQITVTEEGRRIYVKAPFGHPIYERLRAIGATYDRETRRQWVGVVKRDQVKALVIELADAKPAPEDPDKIRLVAKATYKNRTYYVRTISQDARRARLITLDASLDFWVDLETDPGSGGARITKHYQPREVSYGRYARTEYTTLGAIRQFIESIKSDEKAVRDGTAETKVCWECGGSFSRLNAQRNGGDWSDSYCGC